MKRTNWRLFCFKLAIGIFVLTVLTVILPITGFVFMWFGPYIAMLTVAYFLGGVILNKVDK